MGRILTNATHSFFVETVCVPASSCRICNSAVVSIRIYNPFFAALQMRILSSAELQIRRTTSNQIFRKIEVR
jgi:hypothetical protein